MPIEWAIILVAAVSDAILLAETSFRLETSSELRILAGLIPLAVVLVICRRLRSFPRITHRLAHLTRTVLALVLFTMAGNIRQSRVPRRRRASPRTSTASTEILATGPN